MTEKEHSSVVGLTAEVDFTPDPSPEGADTYQEPDPEEELRRLEAESAQETARKARAYYNTFTIGDGQAVLDDLKVGFMKRGSLDEENPNPYLTAFREGQRSVVLLIEKMMEMGEETPE
jgi:hypothetical protein